MNRSEEISNQLSQLRKSRKFWGRGVWLSAFAMIVFPILTIFVMIISVPGIFEMPVNRQMNGIVIVLEIIYLALGITIIGGLFTIISLVVFVVSLSVVFKRGKTLQTLAEKLISE